MQNDNLLSIGPGKGYIVEAYNKGFNGEPLATQSGKEYTQVTLIVTDSSGKSGYVYDQIWGNSQSKIQRLFECANKPVGELESLIGSEIKIIIGIKKGTSGYPDKNIVGCYIK
jgi:hypothetical protein